MKLRGGFLEGKFLLIFAVVLVFLGVFLYIKFFADEKDLVCGDGTLYDECSLNKPYYCKDGILLQNPPTCGCPLGFNEKDGSCFSDLMQQEKTISLQYILNGEIKKIDFVVYDNADSYFSNLPREINYQGNKTPSRVDFKLKFIEEEKQRNLILPLVAEIQNLAESKEDQARIAVSIVQNIEWGDSNKTIKFGRSYLNYSRYPYEVLYETRGLCGEKSQLLAFLLKELGFETAIFYNNAENHESVGIKCSSNDWKETGYCFVETSGPAIISDNSLVYSGNVILQSMPDVLKISEGNELGKIREYSDAENMMKIREKIQNDGMLNFYYKWKYERLKKKYGLGGDYQIG
ncbi:hypothetical protein HY448_02150 [Candidatus Pacearchaeota archaeon]|nr:hypothetical protein [Candidatus Pacearchaeota archaeon]